MPAPRSRELLFRLLQNDVPSGTEIQALVKAFEAQRELEGQWFDLKAGALLRDKSGGDKLRAAVCGFANAEGGFLLIGYNEDTKKFDGVGPVGKQAPDHWAQDALGPIAHEIPLPRYRIVRVAGKSVLLLAVERARALVYVIEKGEPIYYLRFGHQTKRMPQSLIADLMLGRRAQPELRVTGVRVAVVRAERGLADRTGALKIHLVVYYENDALTVAEMVRCGVVSRSSATDRRLPQRLRRSIDLQETIPDNLVETEPYGWGVQHIRSSQPVGVEPFALGQAVLEHWSLPFFAPRHYIMGGGAVPRPEDPAYAAQAQGMLEAKAALYLIAKNMEPLWWQLTLRYGVEAANQLAQNGEHHIRCEPCVYSRPVVSLRFVDVGEPVELA